MQLEQYAFYDRYEFIPRNGTRIFGKRKHLFPLSHLYNRNKYFREMPRNRLLSAKQAKEACPSKLLSL